MMTSRSDEIYTHIYQEILDGTLKPGQRLHIQELAAKFGATLSPVREALGKLTATELVVAISQKGFRVAPISLEDLKDIYHTRIAIESIALQLAIEKGDDAWEAGLIAAFHRLEQFEKKTTLASWSDYQEWEKRHRAFNLALIAACGLTHLLQIQEKIYVQTERYRRLWFKSALVEEKVLRFTEKQKEIMQAALQRDKKTALELLKKHYEMALERIKKVLTR